MIIKTGELQRTHSFDNKINCDGVSMLSTDDDTLGMGSRLHGYRAHSMGVKTME